MILDVGHARNNRPFSQQLALSDWYARIGRETIAYHVHQVVRESSTMKNHRQIDDLYGPLISFSGFFWAWRSSQLNAAPLFVEVRGFDARVQSVEMLLRWPGR